MIDAKAGRDAHIAVNNYGADETQLAAMFSRVLVSHGFKPPLGAEQEHSSVPPHERYLSDQLDHLRDGAKTADPDTNLRLFRSFFESLPDDASATIRFRAKANIGLQHLAQGDGEEAVRWLLEAYDEAPDDPRAAANRALAIWVGGDAEEAYRFGRESLDADPTNETLASYLPQIAVMVPTVQDGLEGIPEALRDKEPVVVGQAVFLRGRDVHPDWWNWVRAGIQRYPDSEHLKLLAAFSQVDEISRDEAAQRSQILSSEQRQRLVEAAAALDEDWQARPWLLKNSYDDGPHTLGAAMVAHQLLHDGEAALVRAKRIADEGLTYPDLLLNAVMVAMSHGDDDLASRLIALAPDDPHLAFHAAVMAVQDGKWTDAARLFGNSSPPESERRVAETVVALAPIKEAGRPADGSAADPAPLEALIEATRDSPRGLIMIAQVAAHLGLRDVSEKAFEAAVGAVPADSHLATRLMVAAFAGRAGSLDTVIRVLDGHLPFIGFEREHERLAIAHANEHPHRQRNLDYFNGLPIALRQQHGIARAHASLLLDIDKLPEAVALFRRLHADDPTDAFVTLRFIDALRRSNDSAGASSVLRRLDLAQSAGSPEHIMVLAHLVMREGFPERAYPVAYDLVRRHSENAQVVLGYTGLGLFLRTPIQMLSVSAVSAGTGVTIQAPDGAQQSFIIDDGGDFFGIRVHSPTSGMAKLVAGLRRGDTFNLPKLGSDPETWTVTEVVSKYLRLHHRALEEFETRFPDKPGIARFTVGEDNFDAVLELVRRSAEQNEKNARVYLENPVPLGVVAKGLGGDVVSFAQFVLRLGGEIITCLGSGEERAHGMKLTRRARGHGAVLDPYTAWVAAEIGVLPALKAWFGTLRTPGATMTMIDRMIERENDGRGQEQMTLSWHEGQFYRDEVTDDHRDRQIAALTRVKDAILADCEIVPVLLPNEISEAAGLVLGMGGSHFLDAAFLARETASLLLSDDMRYRQWASAAVGGDGTWLQAALLTATEDGELSAQHYAKAVAELAKRRHGHVALGGPVLYLIARQDKEGFPDLRAALTYLAGPKAEMRSHRVVFHEFLGWLWPPDDALPELQTKAATGLSLEAYLAHRKWDWVPLLNEVISRSKKDPYLSDYLNAWLRGHFITHERLAKGSAQMAPSRAARRRRLRDRSKRGEKASSKR